MNVKYIANQMVIDWGASQAQKKDLAVLKMAEMLDLRMQEQSH